MKYLPFIFLILYIGCSENPVNPIIITNKPSAPQHIIFEVVQYYTCNDTICPPEESLILIDTTVFSGFTGIANIVTKDSIVYFNNTKFHLDGFVLWNTIASNSYVTINGTTYNLNGFIYTEINLDCNESYPIEYGSNY